MKLYLWQYIIIAIISGVILGLIFPNQAIKLDFLGIWFLKLIKMVIIPLIFFTIIYGITSIEDYTALQTIGIKAVIVFIFSAIIAACIGIVVATVIQPGVFDQRDEIIKFITANKTTVENVNMQQISIIPDNIIKAASEGNILQIIVFGFFFGLMMNINKADILIKVCQDTAETFFQMINKIMILAPIGVFGCTASLIGAGNWEFVGALGKLIYTIIICCIIQYILFGLIILLCKISPLNFYKKILHIQTLAFSTSSSKAVLGTMMLVAEKKLGVSKEGSKLILPLSAALNMDGGAIYQAATVIFFGQIYNIDFSIYQYIIIILMSTIASIGGAGIPSGVILFLGAVLNSVGLPIESIVIITMIDRILDMITTTINVTGDLFATLVIDIWEKKLNKKIYYN
jgi:Na+/H+-dicarboxylate symporter